MPFIGWSWLWIIFNFFFSSLIFYASPVLYYNNLTEDVWVLSIIDVKMIQRGPGGYLLAVLIKKNLQERAAKGCFGGTLFSGFHLPYAVSLLLYWMSCFNYSLILTACIFSFSCQSYFLYILQILRGCNFNQIIKINWIILN